MKKRLQPDSRIFKLTMANLVRRDTTAEAYATWLGTRMPKMAGGLNRFALIKRMIKDTLGEV